MVSRTVRRAWTACTRIAAAPAAVVAWSILLMTGVPSAAFAADGDLDLTFGIGGKVVTNLGGLLEFASAVRVQSDGKIVVAATTFSQVGESFIVLLRYEQDGALDSTFGTNGRVDLHVGQSSFAGDAAIQTDGRIVVVGWTSMNNNQDFLAARVNPDGSLDTSFSGGSVTTSLGSLFGEEATRTAIQSDGKIVAAGITTTSLTTITIPVTAPLPVPLTNHTLRLTLTAAADIELSLGADARFEATRFVGTP